MGQKIVNRIIIFIGLGLFLGLNYYGEYRLNKFPVWIFIINSSLILTILLSSWRLEIYEFKSGIREGFGKRSWRLIHVTPIFLVGFLLLLFPIFSFEDLDFGLTNCFIFGLIVLFKLLTSLNSNYVVLTKRLVIKDTLITYDLNSIDHVAKDKDKITLRRKNDVKYIYLRYMSEKEGSDLLDKLKVICSRRGNMA